MLRQRLAMPALVGVALLGLGLGLGFFVPRWAGLVGGPRVYSSANLLLEVKTVSELVTVQYVIEKVVVVEDIKWVAGLGENRVLLLAHGVVKAGLDLGRLQAADLQVTDKRVFVKLPPAEVTETYLDEKQTQVIDRKIGFFRWEDKELEQTARRNAVEEIRRAALSGGILKAADERARAQLVHLFKQLGFAQVEFRR